LSSPVGGTPDVAALTQVAIADVYKKGLLAARLVRDNGTVRFEYDPGYLARRGPAVATTPPLAEEPVVTARGAVPTYFAGLPPRAAGSVLGEGRSSPRPTTMTLPCCWPSALTRWATSRSFRPDSTPLRRSP
jgi:HipA-like protein